MVLAARKIIKTLPEIHHKKFTVEQSSFLDYQDQSNFDLVLASGFLEYFKHLQPIADHLFKLTAVGGFLAIQVPNREFFRWNGVALAEEKDKGFYHHRISGEECDELMHNSGFEKSYGNYINHFYSPYGRFFPRLHVFLDKHLRKITPRETSRKKASMYCGVYKKI